MREKVYCIFNIYDNSIIEGVADFKERHCHFSLCIDFQGTGNPEQLRILVRTPNYSYEYTKPHFKKTNQRPE
jgi:hypothetical protein